MELQCFTNVKVVVVYTIRFIKTYISLENTMHTSTVKESHFHFWMTFSDFLCEVFLSFSMNINWTL